MSQDDIQKIKERLGIEEVVSTYLKLEKAGKNLKARCPFHNEKTPSFTISPDRGTYYCFGCGAKGDIFTFVQEFEGLDFPGALKQLADQAGIELTKGDFNQKEKYDRLRSVLEMSTRFFQAYLARHPEVKEYLVSRGLNEKTVIDWRIGFVPDGWQNLYTFLQKKGFNDQEITEAGLIKRGEKGKNYDRFRSRIIFPISDAGGRPVAFTGRIWGDDQEAAKYLNSPETPLFEKSKILYGFDRAKTMMRKLDFAILVEGQMDLILSHQAGYKNAVASSGTALTEEQLQLISRVTENLVIAYDSDGAGFRASEKAWKMALTMGMDVKIAPIPKGQDPADVITQSVDNWRQIIKNSKHVIEIIVEQIISDITDDRKKGKAVSERLIPYLASVSSNIDRAFFVKLVGEKLNIPEESISKEITEYKPNEEGISSQKLLKKSDRLINSLSDKKSLKIEKQLIGIILWQETLKNPIVKCDEFRQKIKTIIGDGYEKIVSELEANKEDLIFKAEEIYANLISEKGEIDKEKLKTSIADLLKNLKLKYLLAEREKCKSELLGAERKDDDSEISKCMSRIQELSSKINHLT